MNSPVKIELLAPARNLEAGRAAVDCGADAVYIGGPGWGARHAAGNSVEDIAALVLYARPFGVRVYATLNTLLFDDELADAQRVARELIDVGVDALIVQDMAWPRMGLTRADGSGNAADRAPVEFHASTQTSNMHADEIAFLGRAGFSRVILERWLATDEILAIRGALDTHGLQNIELEAFVHGAMCVGFSGRCFLSRAMSLDGTAGSGDLQNCANGAGISDENSAGRIGPRSGNRGTCSQPCRLPWDLEDGEGRVLVKGKHLLSVPDVDLSGRLDELLEAGVTSLKIEGRLKDTAYVRNIVSYYNSTLNEVICELNKRALLSPPNPLRGSDRRFCRSSIGRSIPDFTPDPAKSFSRASFDTPKSVGEPVGRVEKTGCERTGNWWFTLSTPNGARVGKAGAGRITGVGAAAETPAASLSAGDGICFFADDKLRGTNINRVEAGRIYPNDIEGITSGAEIFRNYDHAFTRTLERSRTRRKIPVRAQISTSPECVEIVFGVVDAINVPRWAPKGGRVAAAESPDDSGTSQGADIFRPTGACLAEVTVSRNGVFEPARDPEKMAATAREELAKSGDTIFEVTDIQSIDALRFVPVSTLAALRREGLAALRDVLAELPPRRNPTAEDPAARFPRTRIEAAENVTNRLAEQFYRDHGVTEFAPPLELQPRLDGATVMRTRHCLRRQLEQCPREKTGPQPMSHDLFLTHGHTRLRLETDCSKCETTLVKL